MKRSRLVVLLCLLLLVACGRPSGPEAPFENLATSGLFFSEYVEGSSNNKALEIYNGTGKPVDLGANGYTVEIYFNGSASPGTTVALEGTVVDGDVFVLADNDAAFAAQADQTSSSSFFNGDDAVVLRQGDAVIDAIGQVGVDPGSEWGSGDASTQNNTLSRQANVCAGDDDPSDPFDPVVQWSGSSQDTFDGLGAHTANCGGEPGTPVLVLNEVDYDQDGTDAAEFLELKSTGSAAVDLGNYTVQLVNGNGGSVYKTIDLPAVSLAAGDYFVVCANAATTFNCDLDVSPDTNLIQNGSPDAVALLLGDEVVDALSYEGSVTGFTEGTGTSAADNNDPFIGLSRSPDGADTDDNNADFSLRCITPGETNSDASSGCSDPAGGGGEPGGEIGQCTDPTTLISEVQGSGATSPLVGQTVTVQGVVVGDFQDDDDGPFSNLNGFHVQEEPEDYDASDETSEGVFVFAGESELPDVQIGQTVRVRGTVGEFESSGSSQTQLADPVAVVCDEGVTPLAPLEVELPVPSRDFLERYEGMLVRFSQNLVISEYFNYDRFGEIVLAQPLPNEDRLYQPTAVAAPDSPEADARADYNARAVITLDDGRSSQNPDPARHPDGDIFDLGNRFRGGDLVQNATGVLDNTFGRYRLQPTQGAEYTRVNPHPQQPEEIGGSLKVASFNVLNYFNGNGTGGGFPTSRGADDLNEFQRQEAKIVSAIIGTDADIVGLIEIENDPAGETSALDDLSEALNAAAGAGTYDYVRTGSIGSDEIKVAFVYKPATVSLVGDYAVLDASVDPRFRDDRNRPALAQTFREVATGGVFTAVVNHFKSKGSSCGAGDDDPVQGNCNETRRLAAEALADWLATDPTGSGDPDVLIIGDLNAYDKEDPIAALREGADDALGTDDDYTDLELAYGGELAYSYGFNGQFGYLDYALANQALLPQVTGVTTWHINADEPDILDYDTSFKQDAQDALYEPNAYRASDHDPVIVGLELTSGDTEAPVITLKRSSQTLFPPNHKYRTLDLAHIVDSVSDDGGDREVADVVITGVSSDEPENGRGDGNTVNDIVLTSCQAVKLRAERSGPGDGRVYTVELAVADKAGNIGTASYQVEVPKGRKGSAKDSGAAYSVAGCELP